MVVSCNSKTNTNYFGRKCPKYHDTHGYKVRMSLTFVSPSDFPSLSTHTHKAYY